MSISVAQTENTSRHNILGKKKKLNWNELNNIDAVDDDEDDNHFILCYRQN